MCRAAGYTPAKTVRIVDGLLVTLPVAIRQSPTERQAIMENAKCGDSSCPKNLSECAESKAVLTDLANQMNLAVQMSRQRSAPANEMNKAIAQWLRILTDKWTDEIDGLKLSSTEMGSLSTLEHSGLIENRGRVLIESDQGTVQFEQIRTGHCTGNTIKAELFRCLPGDWLTAKGRLKRRCTITISPIFRARLTPDGVQAQADYLSPEPSFVFAIIHSIRLPGKIKTIKRDILSTKSEPTETTAVVQAKDNSPRTEMVADHTIKKGDQFWTFRYGGKDTMIPAKLEGLKILKILLSDPNTDYKPFPLLVKAGLRKDGDSESPDTKADAKTIAEVKLKLADLRQQEGTETDPSELAVIREEIRHCEKYLSSVSNIKGDPRKIGNAGRVACKRLIDTVVKAITDKELKNHFEGFIQTGEMYN